MELKDLPTCPKWRGYWVLRAALSSSSKIDQVCADVGHMAVCLKPAEQQVQAIDVAMVTGEGRAKNVIDAGPRAMLVLDAVPPHSANIAPTREAAMQQACALWDVRENAVGHITTPQKNDDAKRAQVPLLWHYASGLAAIRFVSNHVSRSHSPATTLCVMTASGSVRLWRWRASHLHWQSIAAFSTLTAGPTTAALLSSRRFAGGNAEQGSFQVLSAAFVAREPAKQQLERNSIPGLGSNSDPETDTDSGDWPNLRSEQSAQQQTSNHGSHGSRRSSTEMDADNMLLVWLMRHCGARQDAPSSTEEKQVCSYCCCSVKIGGASDVDNDNSAQRNSRATGSQMRTGCGYALPCAVSLGDVCSVDVEPSLNKILYGRNGLWLVSDSIGEMLFHAMPANVAARRAADTELGHTGSFLQRVSIICEPVNSGVPFRVTTHTTSNELVVLDGEGRLHTCPEPRCHAGKDIVLLHLRRGTSICSLAAARNEGDGEREDNENKLLWKLSATNIVDCIAHQQSIFLLRERDTKTGTAAAELLQYCVVSGQLLGRLELPRVGPASLNRIWACGRSGMLGLWGRHRIRCIRTPPVLRTAAQLNSTSESAALCRPWGASLRRACALYAVSSMQSASTAGLSSEALKDDRVWPPENIHDARLPSVDDERLRPFHSNVMPIVLSADQVNAYVGEHERRSLLEQRRQTPFDAAIEPEFSDWVHASYACSTASLNVVDDDAAPECSSPALTDVKLDRAVLPPPVRLITELGTAPSLAPLWQQLFEEVLICGKGQSFDSMGRGDTCNPSPLLFGANPPCTSVDVHDASFFDCMCRFYAESPDTHTLERFVSFVDAHACNFVAISEHASFFARALRCVAVGRTEDDTRLCNVAHLLCAMQRHAQAIGLLLASNKWNAAFSIAKRLHESQGNSVQLALVFQLLLADCARRSAIGEDADGCRLKDVLPFWPRDYTALQALCLVEQVLDSNSSGKHQNLSVAWLQQLLTAR